MPRPRRDGAPTEAPKKVELTEILIRNLEPRERTYRVYDLHQCGLSLQIQPTGHKAWKCIYSIRGRRRWFSIGGAHAVGLAEARVKATEVLYKVAQGLDPCAEKKAARATNTFADVATRYLEEHAKVRIRSWRQADKLVQRHLLACWGQLQIDAITRQDAKAAFQLTNRLDCFFFICGHKCRASLRQGGFVLAVPKTRRTQQERSAETRLLLLDAAVALIHDRGLNNISTTDVAYAAGVSRGALTHHFVSREDLVAAAIEHMLDEAIRKLKSYTAQVARARASSDELIDFLYDLMADRLFYATLEFLPEARHNTVFRNRIVPMIGEWHAALDLIWSELMQRYGIGTVEGRDLMNATMCLIRGMIAQTIIRDDPPYFKRLLRFWKASVRAQLAETTKKAKPKARQRARQLLPT